METFSYRISTLLPESSVVVLPGGVDTNTGHKIGAMQVNVPKDADGNPILSDPDSPDAQAAISSPLTLILAQNSDIVEADLIAQLGMTGVEEKGLAFYDPVSEMQAGNNNSLAEYVFTIQQQLFSIIQAGSKIAGEAAGLSALEVSVQAVGDAMKTALENGTALLLMELLLLLSPALQMALVFPILPLVLHQLFKQRIKKLPRVTMEWPWLCLILRMKILYPYYQTQGPQLQLRRIHFCPLLKHHCPPIALIQQYLEPL